MNTATGPFRNVKERMTVQRNGHEWSRIRPFVPTSVAGGRAFSTVAMAKKKKDVRMVITLECTESRALGVTPSRYTTEKVCHV